MKPEKSVKKKLKIEQTPNSFGELINEIKNFVMPPCVAAAHNLKFFKFDKIWSISGYWQDANNS
jgi:hypothetical protein